ncbi:MAG: hypothetical protein WA678_05840 [Rhabdochlamydiaceae bacterium]
MTTQRQIAANRINAQHSTGPKSQQGREAVSQNALKHGIFSRQILLEDESINEFESLKMEFHDQFQPQGMLEQLFCERALAAAWRLSRITKMESMLITYAIKKSYDSSGIIEVLGGFGGDKLSLLSRYEITLEKILFRSISELKTLQATRSRSLKNGFVLQNLSEESIAEEVI